MAPSHSTPSSRGIATPKFHRPSVGGKTVSSGKGVARALDGRGFGGRGLGKTTHRRHNKILKDNIMCITKADIRRMARRGGIKRISGAIYEDVRQVLKNYLEIMLRDCVAICEHSKRKTVTVTDVIFALRRRGRPIYGFDQDTFNATKKPSRP
ncbi:Histone H4 [Venustampulla echinocandica]|uniref:Histone H4 n=1 Tax=Venustampulla echinocandica TaxID=2656787 RepID=A0A370TWF7_9HELO|nr:Histone H4 [Venustampulla echinocandica]RDL39864.1 Histone H4 [Venustampulla echinocandica]